MNPQGDAALVAAGARVVSLASFEASIKQAPLKSLKVQPEACRRCRSNKKFCNMRPSGCERCAERGLICDYSATTEADRLRETSPTTSTSPKPIKKARRTVTPLSPAGRSRSGSLSLSNVSSSSSFSFIGQSPDEASFTEVDSASSTDFLVSSNNNLSTGLALVPIEAAVPVSLSPFPMLPLPEDINLFVSEYFSEVELVLPMLSKTRARMPSDLLLSSMLLAAPHLSPRPNPSINSSFSISSKRTWDMALFPRAKAEMLALLDRGPAHFTVQDCTAIVNLATWAMFRGLTNLRQQFMWLLILGSKVMSEICARAGPEPPVDSKEAWISYWEKQRCCNSMLILLWRQAEWALNPHGNPEFDLRILDRPAPPMPQVWEAVQNTDPLLFDPATLPKTVMLSEVVAFLKHPATDPHRMPLLHRATSMLIDVRFAINWLTIVLRNRVDKFLAACLGAGLSTPAQLPSFNSPALDPAVQALIAMRTELDVTLLQIKAGFPPVIKQALEEGDALTVVTTIGNAAGAPRLGFNYAPLWTAIGMLRLELFSSFGNLFTAASPPSRNMEADCEKLASEFPADPLHMGLLEEAIVFTRFLENWLLVNPSFEHHAGTNFNVIFRTCVLHASFRRKFLLGAPKVHTEALAHVDHSFNVCLDVLRRYALKGPWASSIYNLAVKVANAADIDGGELGKATWRTQMEVEPEGLLEQMSKYEQIQM